MKNLQEQLNAISKSLVTISREVEKIARKAEKLAPATPAGRKTKAEAARKADTKKPVAKTAADRSATVLDTVYDAVRRSRKGVSIAKLKEKTGLQPRQLSNALYKLSNKGKIEAKSRGIYVKKASR